MWAEYFINSESLIDKSGWCECLKTYLITAKNVLDNYYLSNRTGKTEIKIVLEGYGINRHSCCLDRYDKKRITVDNFVIKNVLDIRSRFQM